MNIKEHNNEVKKVWDSFYAGTPIRIPIVCGVYEAYYMQSKDTNKNNISFYDYTYNPKIMFDVQCDFTKFQRYLVPGDHEMGIPENGWEINVDLQNYYESAWLGCDVKFKGNEVPYATPILNDDNKHMLFEKGIPEVNTGCLKMGLEYFEKFHDYSKNHLIDGQKISKINLSFTGTDGMFTIACELRGAENACMDMLEDPEYFHQLMDYLTEANIKRLKYLRKFIGEDEISSGFGFADDSIALISHEAYKEFVLPYHKRLAEATSTMKEKGFAHLCGDASRHFKTIRDELNVYTFDTGFPIDHAKMIDQLGPDIILQGGILATELINGSAEKIEAETKRIIENVKHKTKKFIFREANATAPNTPIANLEAMYSAGKKYGTY